jgi:hypothetical protein
LALPGRRRRACRLSPVGKLLPNALYVHRSALESLDPLLSISEGCARADLGEIDGANLIRLHRHSGAVSYLVYPDFQADPHSALLRSVKLNLRTREIDCLEFADIPWTSRDARRPGANPDDSLGYRFVIGYLNTNNPAQRFKPPSVLGDWATKDPESS